MTYCMVTPVVAGTMALRPEAYGRTTRAFVGWLGVIFGALNMVIWFLLDPASWWMGTLHLPLMVICALLVVTTRREPRETGAPESYTSVRSVAQSPVTASSRFANAGANSCTIAS